MAWSSLAPQRSSTTSAHLLSRRHEDVCDPSDYPAPRGRQGAYPPGFVPRTAYLMRARTATGLRLSHRVKVATNSPAQPQAQTAAPAGSPGGAGARIHMTRQPPAHARSATNSLLARTGRDAGLGERPAFPVRAGRAHGLSHSSAGCPGCRPRPGRLSGRPIRDAADRAGLETALLAGSRWVTGCPKATISVGSDSRRLRALELRAPELVAETVRRMALVAG
jgi:hypothetical protein